MIEPSSLAVLVPVLHRPQRVAPLVASLFDSVQPEAEAGWQIEVLFICSPRDLPEQEAVRAAGLEPLIASWNPETPGDYARKINLAARTSEAEWLFTGADDIRFHAGWLGTALALHEQTGALVVGTNDLGNQAVLLGNHSTHSLVHRSYLRRAVADAPGNLLCERYDHNCSDVELVETAQALGVWAFAKEAIVEHEHWLWGKAERDAVYRKGIRRSQLDRRLLAQRRRLWARS